MMRSVVEICVEGIESAAAALRGGADRVELCESMAVGGLTPVQGSAFNACQKLKIPVQVLIRPRTGDFVYDIGDFQKMIDAIGFVKAPGASGVVIGVLTADERVDRERMERLIETARPMSVTFHKAFDAVRDPFEALDDLIALGVDRVLTSGQAPTARDGLDVLQELTRRAEGRIAVMAGGSIQLDQVRSFVAAGIKEIHLGSAAIRDGATDRELVRSIVEAARVDWIYHVTTREEWQKGWDEGLYQPESLAAEGFIHASTERQLNGTISRFFLYKRGLVLLKIDLDRVKPPIRWVDSPDAPDPFPHIEGPLNLGAVVSIDSLDTEF